MKVTTKVNGKRRTRTETEAVLTASGHGTVAPGRSVTSTPALNSTGRALLKKLHKLTATVYVKVGSTVIERSTVTLVQSKAKKPKHHDK